MTRSQDRYDRFAKAVDTPMLVITLLWLPVLIVPLGNPRPRRFGLVLENHQLHGMGIIRRGRRAQDVARPRAWPLLQNASP